MPFSVAMLYFGLIHENSFLRRMLSANPMRLLGRSSYAFYLLHLPLIVYLATPLIKPYFSNSYYNLYVITVFAITVMLSVVVFVFYERPVNAFIL
jgi:peptidoglycan/LPS O-acetylase OafA/YrhL